MAKQRTGEVLRSAERMLSVLDWFSFGQPEGTVASISRSLELSESTVRRLLQVLQARGYVAPGATPGSYRLHWRILRLSSILRGTNPMVRAAAEHLDLLHGRFSEAVVLSVLDGADVVHIDARDAVDHPPFYRPVGYSWKAYAGGATGRVLLAWLAEDEVRTLVPDEPSWHDGGEDWDRLLADLAEVRAHHYGTNRDDGNPALWAVSAPVRDGSGDVCAGLSLAIMRERATPEVQRDATNAVRSAALGISAGLGAAVPADT